MLLCEAGLGASGSSWLQLFWVGLIKETHTKFSELHGEIPSDISASHTVQLSSSPLPQNLSGKLLNTFYSFYDLLLAFCEALGDAAQLCERLACLHPSNVPQVHRHI